MATPGQPPRPQEATRDAPRVGEARPGPPSGWRPSGASRGLAGFTSTETEPTLRDVHEMARRVRGVAEPSSTRGTQSRRPRVLGVPGSEGRLADDEQKQQRASRQEQHWHQHRRAGRFLDEECAPQTLSCATMHRRPGRGGARRLRRITGRHHPASGTQVPAPRPRGVSEPRSRTTSAAAAGRMARAMRYVDGEGDARRCDADAGACGGMNFVRRPRGPRGERRFWRGFPGVPSVLSGSVSRRRRRRRVRDPAGRVRRRSGEERASGRRRRATRTTRRETIPVGGASGGVLPALTWDTASADREGRRDGSGPRPVDRSRGASTTAPRAPATAKVTMRRRRGVGGRPSRSTASRVRRVLLRRALLRLREPGAGRPRRRRRNRRVDAVRRPKRAARRRVGGRAGRVREGENAAVRSLPPEGRT